MKNNALPCSLVQIYWLLKGACYILTRDCSSMFLTWHHITVHNILHRYLLTPRSTVLLQKLTSLQLVKKFPTFYGARRFITAFTSARHLSLSSASLIQSTLLHPTTWRSILILSSHLCLGLPSGLFPSGFPTKTPYTPLPSHIRATCPTHLILLDFITQTILGEKYRVRINYWRILQSHIFTNTEQKYMMLLPFEREMFAVS